MATEQVFFGSFRGVHSPASGSKTSFPFGLGDIPAISGGGACWLPISGTIKDFRVELGTAPGSGNTSWFFMGTSTHEIFTPISGTNTVGINNTDNIHVDKETFLRLRTRRGGGSAAPSTTMGWSFRFIPDIDNQTFIGSDGFTATLSSSSTNYIHFAGFHTSFINAQTDTAILIPTAGTLKNIFIWTDQTMSVGQKRVFTLQHTTFPTDSTFDDSLNLTLDDTTNQGSNNYSSQTIGSLSVNAGDRIVLKEVPTGTPTACKCLASIVFEPTKKGEFILPMQEKANLANNKFCQLFGGATEAQWRTTEEDTNILAGGFSEGSSVKVKAMYAYFNGGFGRFGTKWKIHFRKNSVDQFTISRNDGKGSASATGSVSLNDGDSINFRSESVNNSFGQAPKPRPVNVSCLLEASQRATVHILGKTTILGKTDIK